MFENRTGVVKKDSRQEESKVIGHGDAETRRHSVGARERGRKGIGHGDAGGTPEGESGREGEWEKNR